MGQQKTSIICKGCGKAIGYYKDTGKKEPIMNTTLVELVQTHMTTRDEVVFPKAKIDKYKYGKVSRCDYCNTKY